MNPSNPLADDSAGACQESYATALRLLARREHSELELRHKLIGRSFADTIVDVVVVQLLDQGLLSDQRFAEVYARGRFERGYGPLRIRAELRERGVSGDLTEQNLAELSRSWVESASRQRSKRFGRQFPGDYRERAKQMRFLQQRGFTSDQIQTVFAAA
ncbi:MAG: regulatory protein RecX [Pseudomonadota bacterium]|nr:regulatory protein RecX [Pseudomonadota bacterium]